MGNWLLVIEGILLMCLTVVLVASALGAYVSVKLSNNGDATISAIFTGLSLAGIVAVLADLWRA